MRGPAVRLERAEVEIFLEDQLAHAPAIRQACADERRAEDEQRERPPSREHPLQPAAVAVGPLRRLGKIIQRQPGEDAQREDRADHALARPPQFLEERQRVPADPEERRVAAHRVKGRAGQQHEQERRSDAQPCRRRVRPRRRASPRGHPHQQRADEHDDGHDADVETAGPVLEARRRPVPAEISRHAVQERHEQRGQHSRIHGGLADLRVHHAAVERRCAHQFQRRKDLRHRQENPQRAQRRERGDRRDERAPALPFPRFPQAEHARRTAQSRRAGTARPPDSPPASACPAPARPARSTARAATAPRARRAGTPAGNHAIAACDGRNSMRVSQYVLKPSIVAASSDPSRETRHTRQSAYPAAAVSHVWKITSAAVASVTGRSRYRRFGGYRTAPSMFARNGSPQPVYGFHSGRAPCAEDFAGIDVERVMLLEEVAHQEDGVRRGGTARRRGRPSRRG